MLVIERLEMLAWELAYLRTLYCYGRQAPPFSSNALWKVSTAWTNENVEEERILWLETYVLLKALGKPCFPSVYEKIKLLIPFAHERYLSFQGR